MHPAFAELKGSLFPPHAFRFKGGAPGIPTQPPPAAPALNNVAVTQEEQQTKQQMLQKQGITASLLSYDSTAGQTPPGLLSPAATAGKGSLLGGG